MEEKEITRGVFLIEAPSATLTNLKHGALEELRQRRPNDVIILKEAGDPVDIFYLQKFSFSVALMLMKDGIRVARQGWDGRNTYLFLVNNGRFGKGDVGLLPFIVMKTAQGGFVPWLASQTDLIEEDWVVVDSGR